MRLHHLRIEAFGPFAAEVTVDLDQLSDAGLFLLTGPTGAGKTSVLDAICFALYGAVPGDRQAAKRLRSDQAAPGAAPSVTLEFTVDGRRFRIDRSPGWQRPKKRGTGLTTEQPSVLVRERVDGAWQPLATRLDDAGHLVTGLLGMNLTQFCQVQLLPQGQFQAFLRADSHERHQLLQQLFRTARFEDVETWLRERRRSLGRESVRHHESVADLVSRVSEASGRPVPDHWDLHGLAPVVTGIAPWAEELLADAVEADGAAETATAAAMSTEAAARCGLETGRLLAERQQRVTRARAEQSTLTDDEPAHRRRARRLDAARRAAAVIPVAGVAERASADQVAAETAAAAASARAGELLGRSDLSVAELRDRERHAVEGAARARALAPRAAEHDRLTRQLAAGATRSTQVAVDLDIIDQRLGELPAAVAARRTAEAEARRAVDALEAARSRAELARERRDAGRQVAELVKLRIEAEDLLRQSVDHAQTVTAHWLELQELRLTGMAAEIAGALAVGADCPVCGSHDHPRPAQALAGAPDAEAVRVARSAVDDAEVFRQARDGAVADLQLQIGRARERAGHLTVPALERELADQEARVARLETHAATLPSETRALAAAERELADLATRRGELDAERSALKASLAEWRTRAEEIEAELAALLDGTDQVSATDLARHLDTLARVCGAAAGALVERDRLRVAAAEARDRAATLAHDRDFDTVSAACAAALGTDELDALDQQVRDRDTRWATVAAVLSDPDLVAAAAADPPELARLAADHAAAAESLARSRDVAATRRRCTERLTRLSAGLSAALAGWEPVRERYELTDRMASLADGTSPDNRLRMRLSGYVLAFRLRQVVDAANERLVAMTDRRYRLEHSGDRGAGESRGGLSLRIRDDWTGETRDPVTLSGGETFVVSLALALGLADVIAHEAGGSELDTLFVDEGFGTLDADTLDDVMDTLDSLRDGGRVVGVVSHVAELQMRIPMQLHVRKHRSGSTLHQAAIL
ncbi:MAG: AAA family ATPase [Nocardioides sp.]